MRRLSSNPRGAAELWALILIVGAAFAAGAINAVAGGGSFLTFPALLAAGVAPIQANATSTVALWPASFASALAYRGEQVPRRYWVMLGITSLIGGLLGAFLLVSTSQRTFSLLIPFLLLLATLLFTFGSQLTALVWRVTRADRGIPLWLGLPLQLVVATYGGYFGGGMGIMMLALFTLLGLTRIHQMNQLKNGLAVVLNGVAVAVFAAKHAVIWTDALWMAGAGIAGGYLGATLARRVEPQKFRRVVAVMAWIITAYFFVWSFALRRA